MFVKSKLINLCFSINVGLQNSEGIDTKADAPFVKMVNCMI